MAVNSALLVAYARAARVHAYCPYSGFPVGAALLASSGEVYCGVNCESASYGATICAERAALTAAVTAGETAFVALAVAAGEEPVPPCGVCRQLLAEFGDMAVICAAGEPGAQGDPLRETTLSALLTGIQKFKHKDLYMTRLTDIGTIKDILSRHGFQFSKKLGQNFLINPSVCPRMAEACGASPQGGVLEIGPGIGVLTHELAQRAAKVVAIELDERLLPVLGETLAEHDNVEIVSGDVLKLDLAALIRERFEGREVAVCANLPYYITSPILMRLLESRLPVTGITVMVQKEAAIRLCARPGTRECGAVSLAVQYYAEAETLFSVSRGSFLPAPNVDSAVIRLTVRKTPPCAVRNEALLFRLIRSAFGQRRKTLPNALVTAGCSKAAVQAAMRAVSIPETARAEELTLPQFASLADALDGPAA